MQKKFSAFICKICTWDFANGNGPGDGLAPQRSLGTPSPSQGGRGQGRLRVTASGTYSKRPDRAAAAEAAQRQQRPQGRTARRHSEWQPPLVGTVTGSLTDTVVS